MGQKNGTRSTSAPSPFVTRLQTLPHSHASPFGAEGDSYVVMEKMNVRSLAELVLIAKRLLLKEKGPSSGKAGGVSYWREIPTCWRAITRTCLPALIKASSPGPAVSVFPRWTLDDVYRYARRC
jgi:hypothetical protein